MFGINPNTFDDFKFSDEQRKKIESVYDTALVIKDVFEYCKRIKLKAESEGIEIDGGFVKYYDECIDLPNLFLNLSNGIEKIVFYKRKKYSVQQEYRFTSPNPQNLMNLEFNIGDISDISVQLPSTELFKAIISKRNK